jgi:hypothetical protein
LLDRDERLRLQRGESGTAEQLEQAHREAAAAAIRTTDPARVQATTGSCGNPHY